MDRRHARALLALLLPLLSATAMDNNIPSAPVPPASPATQPAAEARTLAEIERKYAALVFTDSFDAQGRPVEASSIYRDAEMRRLVGSLRDDGTWPGIDYDSPLRSQWPTGAHARNVCILARIAAAKRHDGAEAAFHRALAYWLDRTPTSKNWWWNQIGAPQAVGQAALVADTAGFLSEAERARVADYLAVGGSPAKFTGQNRVWIAEVALMRALLARDYAAARAMRDIIVAELAIAGPGKEGIQPDGSFHQHGPLTQLGNYGLNFFRTQAFFCAVFADTDFALGADERAPLLFLANEGYRWVFWRGYIETGSLGRQLFPNFGRTKARAAAVAAGFLALDGTPETAEIRDAIVADTTPGDSVPRPLSRTGFKYFPKSAFGIYRTPTWMVNIRMHTPAIRGTEQVNEDNLLGAHMADGAVYFHSAGDDYENIYPMWHWRQVPGVTSYADRPIQRNAKPNERNQSHFVRGAAFGERNEIGVAAMELDRDGLRAHKAWLLTPQFYVAVGCGISSDAPDEVTTCIDQCRLRGRVTVLDTATGSWSAPVARTQVGDFPGGEVRVLHGTTGYVIRGKDLRVRLSAEERTGSWRSVMGSIPEESATANGRVFELTIMHGPSPSGASYEYWVIPDTTPDALAAFSPDDHASVASSTPALQRFVLARRGLTASVTPEGVSFAPTSASAQP